MALRKKKRDITRDCKNKEILQWPTERIFQPVTLALPGTVLKPRVPQPLLV